MMSVQIAIVGIVVVVGLFVLWRRIARLEERVEALSNMQRLMSSGGAMGGMCIAEEDEGVVRHGMPDDDIMAAIFDLPLGRGHAGIVDGGERADITIVEEEGEDMGYDEVAGGDEGDEGDEGEDGEGDEGDAGESARAAVPTLHMRLHDGEDSETSIVHSKSKLRKLTIDELKSMLDTRGLSTEGNKAALVDRLHAHAEAA